MFDSSGERGRLSVLLQDAIGRSTMLVTASLVLLAAWLVSRAAKRLIARLHALGHLTPVMAERLHLIRRWVIWSVALLLLFQISGFFSHAWALLSASLAAVAIGFFAAWSIISNMTAALLIVALRPFRIGDQVELVEPNNGTALGGEVLDMNLMFTTLRERNPATGAEAQLHVPNNLFLQKLIRSRRRGGVHERVSFFDQSSTGPEP